MGTSSMRAAALCAVAAASVFAATATPSSNDYASVTGDWARGDYTNVYEWAQARLAADTNDLPAAYVMPGKPLTCSPFLKIMWDNGLW